MKFIDLKDKSQSELNNLLVKKKEELFILKVKHKTMQLQNTNELRVAKKDIAKIKTAITMKMNTHKVIDS